MKKYCLCISDLKASKTLSKNKVDKFTKKHNGREPTEAELDVIEAEVENERSEFCNKQS